MAAMSSSTVPLMMDIEGGQPDEMESGRSIKNDFAYNNNVAGAAKHIRMGFLRKVYGLLSMQLALTTVIASICLFTPQVKELIHANPWLTIVGLFASLAILLALHVKRKETPINMILLAAFTVVESYTVGVIVTMYDVAVVVQAFFLTAAVVIALTVYTFQTTKDFSSWGIGLFTGLWILILGGFMQLLVGGEATDIALAVLGAFIFSGFIIFDTQMIMTRVSPEEYIIATIELYLDIINLFIEILKILEKANRK